MSSRMQQLGESLLTQEELFHDVLASAPDAPDELTGEVLTVSTPIGEPRRIDAPPPPSSSHGLRRQSRPSFASYILTGVGLCCACLRSKHTRTEPPTQKKGNDKRSSSSTVARSHRKKKHVTTYIDSDHQRDRQLRARLGVSKRYAAYLKDCNASLLTRLTSEEGKALIQTIVKDEGKTVPEVVEALVKGLQEQATREYIRRVREKEKAAEAADATAGGVATTAGRNGGSGGGTDEYDTATVEPAVPETVS